MKSWLARCTRRPPTEAAPVTTPSAGMLLPSMPNRVARCSANRPISSKLSGSTSASMRSRAVSLPDLALLFELVRAAAQHYRARAAASALRSSPALPWWSYFELSCPGFINSVLRRLAAARKHSRRRYRHLVGLAVQLHVVGNRGAHRALRRFPPPGPRPGLAPAPRAGSLPRFFGPFARAGKNFGATCGNIA